MSHGYGTLAQALASGLFDVDRKGFHVVKPQEKPSAEVRTATWRCHATWRNRQMVILAFGMDAWECAVLGMWHVAGMAVAVRDELLAGSVILSEWHPLPRYDGDIINGAWVERRRPLVDWIRDEELRRVVLPMDRERDSWGRKRRPRERLKLH